MAARAVAVIGPVDKGDRISERKGASTIGRGMERMSIIAKNKIQRENLSSIPIDDIPFVSLMLRLSSSNPAINPAS